MSNSSMLNDRDQASARLLQIEAEYLDLIASCFDRANPKVIAQLDQAVICLGNARRMLTPKGSLL